LAARSQPVLLFGVAVSAGLGGREAHDPFGAAVPEGPDERGIVMRRAKLGAQVERLVSVGRGNVERDIAGGILRGGRAHGLRPCRRAERQRGGYPSHHDSQFNGKAWYTRLQSRSCGGNQRDFSRV